MLFFHRPASPGDAPPRATCPEGPPTPAQGPAGWTKVAFRALAGLAVLGRYPRCVKFGFRLAPSWSGTVLSETVPAACPNGFSLCARINEREAQPNRREAMQVIA